MDEIKELVVALEVEINAQPEEVWAIIGNSEGMARWLGMDGLEPKVGAQWEMLVTTDNGEFQFFGVVKNVDANKELTFTWIQQEKGQEPWPADTLVSIYLTPTPNGTKVVLLHSGFEDLPEQLAKEEWQGHQIGWESRKVLYRLKDLIETGE